MNLITLQIQESAHFKCHRKKAKRRKTNENLIENGKDVNCFWPVFMQHLFMTTVGRDKWIC